MGQATKVRGERAIRKTCNNHPKPNSSSYIHFDMINSR